MDRLFYKPNNKNSEGQELCGLCGKPGTMNDAVDLNDPAWRHYAVHRDCKFPDMSLMDQFN